ncbi:MAG TPA: glycoside hydrolase family 44 protein [Polyangiales bacterium]
MKNATWSFAACAVWFLPALALADASVIVDPSADAHVISPLIYGVNFAKAAQLDAGKLTVTRRGGNSTTRYNYEIDVHNTGSDWYFENISDCQGTCPPADAKESSSANAFLSDAHAHGVAALFTIPTIGYTPKAPAKYAHPYDCGCPKSVTAQQYSFDQWDSACGDGKDTANKNWVTCAPPSATSTPTDPAWAKTWVSYLVGKFGASNGQRIYSLDNEPALWSSTHHDLRPQHLGYDELWQRMRDYAVAILEADPSALVSGPAEWGWPNYLCSDLDDVSKGCSAQSPDRKAHGGEELVAWLLDQAKAYEQAHGQRILHFLDLHYYPQGGNVPDNTRSLWDPSYPDPSWINDTIRLIPRMRAWVDQHYPGTKLSISEFDFGEHDSALGAVTYAEVLGIFGREGLDMATAWSPPAATEKAFSAYRLYRNFDGQGGHFEDVGVKTSVTGSGVQAFAAVSSTRVTTVLINETGSSQTVHVSFGNFTTGKNAQLYGNASGATITKQPDVTLSAGAASVSLPASSISLLIVDGTNPNALPVATRPAAGTDAGTLPSGKPRDAGSASASADAGLGHAVDAALAPAGAAGTGVSVARDGGTAVPARRASGCSCQSAAGAPMHMGLAWLVGVLPIILVRRRRLTAVAARGEDRTHG